MQFFQTITIPANIINAILSDSDDRIAMITGELEKQIDQGSALLTSYHWHEKGIVETVKIESDSVQIDKTGKGRFAVRYAINIHYGCSDVDIDLDKKMAIGIQINLLSGEAVLAGEYIPEREPDEF